MKIEIENLIKRNDRKIADLEDELCTSEKLFPNEDAHIHGELFILRDVNQRLRKIVSPLSVALLLDDNPAPSD